MKNKWPPSSTPHKNHSEFPFDPIANNPIKGQRTDLGVGKPTPGSSQTGNPPAEEKWHFETLAVALFGLIDLFNAKLAAYKADPNATTEGDYQNAVKDIENYIKMGADTHVKQGTLDVEVVEVDGFVVSFRLIGHPAHSHGKGIRFDHSSSSRYSVYSPQP